MISDNNNNQKEKKNEENKLKLILAAIQKSKTYLESFKIQTDLIFWLFLLLILANLFQTMNVWQGSYLYIPHALLSVDHSSQTVYWYEHKQEKHPLIQYHEKLPVHDPLHPNNFQRGHHHDHHSFESIVKNHWQTSAMSYIFHLNLMVVASIILRFLYTSSKNRSMIILVITFFILIISVFLQVGAISLRLYVLWFYTSFSGFFGLLLNTILFLLEFSSAVDLYLLRSKIMFLAHQMYLSAYQENFAINKKPKFSNNFDKISNFIQKKIFCCGTTDNIHKNQTHNKII